MLAACRAQVQRLKLNYSILDQVAGFTDGYTSKLFAASEYSSNGWSSVETPLQPEWFDAYVEALGVDLVMVENPEKVAETQKLL